MKGILRFTCAALVLSSAGSAVMAETVDCIDVESVNFAITAPGVYCLKRSVSGRNIFIAANDVVLDLNGHVLDATGITGAGVGSNTGVSGTTIRNGVIRGARNGVSLSNGVSSRVSGYLIERLRIEDSTVCGICVQGDGGLVRDNVIMGVGSATSGVRAGINVTSGAGVRVSDNLVVDMIFNPGQVNGIRAADSPGAIVERNVVSNTVLPSSSGATGIHLSRSSSSTTPMRTIVAGNRVVNMQIGINNFADASLFVDNAVGGATTPFSGGTMAGTTNYSF
jgi:hypothetical protein